MRPRCWCGKAVSVGPCAIEPLPASLLRPANGAVVSRGFPADLLCMVPGGRLRLDDAKPASQLWKTWRNHLTAPSSTSTPPLTGFGSCNCSFAICPSH